MRIARVVKSHRPDSTISISMKRGDILQGERRPTDWEGWLWCTDKDGVSAWVPEEYLFKTQSPDLYQATCDYISTELEVDTGHKITVLYEVAGWAWAITSNEKEGWIPLENIQKLDE